MKPYGPKLLNLLKANGWNFAHVAALYKVDSGTVGRWAKRYLPVELAKARADGRAKPHGRKRLWLPDLTDEACTQEVRQALARNKNYVGAAARDLGVHHYLFARWCTLHGVPFLRGGPKAVVERKTAKPGPGDEWR